mmetsp:Transcript_42324/g.55785  ORF Transcript_42324/g.55785 Transcript_42324/m.55785 type:complete len:83 (-) Transcript_42324:100-348(-)
MTTPEGVIPEAGSSEDSEDSQPNHSNTMPSGAAATLQRNTIVSGSVARTSLIHQPSMPVIAETEESDDGFSLKNTFMENSVR